MIDKNSKGFKFLLNDRLHTETYEEIKKDIEQIMNDYDLKKTNNVNYNGKGKLIIDIQDNFPSNLLLELNKYMGFEAIIKHKVNSTCLEYYLTDKMF